MMRIAANTNLLTKLQRSALHYFCACAQGGGKQYLQPPSFSSSPCARWTRTASGLGRGIQQGQPGRGQPVDSDMPHRTFTARPLRSGQRTSLLIPQHFRGTFVRYPSKRGHVDLPTISIGFLPVSYVRPYVGS